MYVKSIFFGDNLYYTSIILNSNSIYNVNANIFKYRPFLCQQPHKWKQFKNISLKITYYIHIYEHK